MELVKKRIMAIFLVAVILFQIFFPSIYSYGIEDENNLKNEIIKDVDNKVEQEVTEENQEIDNNEELENDKEKQEEFEMVMNEDAGISVASASGYGVGAGNENEFRNAFYNGGVSELTTSEVIRLTSSYTVNHNIRINSSSTSGGNALQLSSGCNIVVPNGCVLTLDGMVVDGRSWGNNDGKSCITVQNGGVLMLIEHSIIDRRNKELGH